MIIKCLSVGIGGFIGSILRYLISEIPIKQINYPINTLFTNVIGAVIIGMVIPSADNSGMHPEKSLLLKTGFCGGLTTFSTFSLEAFNLLDNKQYTLGGLYIVLSVVCCIFGILCGKRLASVVKL